jgi:hypothetical protein
MPLTEAEMAGDAMIDGDTSGKTEEAIRQARVDLVRIAASIGDLVAREDASLDLLEAERSIHHAVVALDLYDMWRRPGPPPMISQNLS